MEDKDMPASWLELMALLERLEQQVSSEEEEKWTDAQQMARQLDIGMKRFFSENTDLSPSVAAQIAMDGERVMRMMSSMLAGAAQQKQEMGKEISGFLKGQKGIKAYKKV